MKRNVVSKAIKLVYLLCCLSVAFLPNNLNGMDETEEAKLTELEMEADDKISAYSEQLEELGKEAIENHEGLTSLVVMKDGKVYMERYYNGNDASSLFEVHSCTKTVIALMAGIAQDKGMMGDENSRYIDMFDGLNLPEVSEGFERVTIKDMLTMSSGLNWDKYSESIKNRVDIITKGLNYGLNLIPSAEMKGEPGTEFNYDSNESRGLMAMIAYCSGMTDIDFAQTYLFGKLEIEDYLWPYNDSGLLLGGKDLFLSSRDLAKIGQLILDGGSYKGEQIVSEEWINKMLTPVLKDVLCEDIIPEDTLDYGFYVWHTAYKGVDVNFAYGRGGQYIFMVPEYNICVVTSAIDKVRSDNFRQMAFDVIDIFQGED